ncbi:MAG: hypothetical protein JKY67_08105 [Pseudomonadales bacterium]|nr:hypothetical protein [Pseudomonadales bacterium]
MRLYIIKTLSPFILSLSITLFVALPKLGYCDIAVIVNSENPVTLLSKEEVRNIFLGRMTRFPRTDLAVSLVEIRGNSAQKERFYKIVVNKSITKVNRYWARYLFTGKMTPPKKLANSKQVINELIKNPSGVSYIDSSELSPLVKVVLVIPE